MILIYVILGIILSVAVGEYFYFTAAIRKEKNRYLETINTIRKLNSKEIDYIRIINSRDDEPSIEEIIWAKNQTPADVNESYFCKLNK